MLAGRRHHGIRGKRQDQLYARRNFLRALMRYFLLAVAPPPIGQRVLTLSTLLISPAGRRHPPFSARTIAVLELAHLRNTVTN